jgi:hypothetical protein
MRIDLSGHRFGKLAVLRDATALSGRTAFLCKCDCGTQKVILLQSLRNGSTVSCGCRRRTHGKTKTAEFGVWQGMLNRCYNSNEPAFRHYGGRGIKVCDSWKNSFETFLQDVGLRPSKGYSIDRIDVNGNYEPGNVKWATQQEQMRNTRRNHRIAVNGETRSLVEWAELTGIDRQTIETRIASGWSPEKAIGTPTRQSPARARAELNAVLQRFLEQRQRRKTDEQSEKLAADVTVLCEELARVG